MPTELSGNMRARSTARVNCARVGNARVGGVMRDVDTANTQNQYPWTMERGVKPLDTAFNDTQWTQERR